MEKPQVVPWGSRKPTISPNHTSSGANTKQPVGPGDRETPGIGGSNIGGEKRVGRPKGRGQDVGPREKSLGGWEKGHRQLLIFGKNTTVAGREHNLQNIN